VQGVEGWLGWGRNLSHAACFPRTVQVQRCESKMVQNGCESRMVQNGKSDRTHLGSQQDASLAYNLAAEGR
jgi:hypothetical protein